MRELRFAVKNTIPIFFTYLFIGIAFGVLTVDAGYSVLLSVASAFFIFAGSMQLVMIPMMTSGASLLTLALMTFFINTRHIFYGISFVERFRKRGLAWRVHDPDADGRDLLRALLDTIRTRIGREQGDFLHRPAQSPLLDIRLSGRRVRGQAVAL